MDNFWSLEEFVEDLHFFGRGHVIGQPGKGSGFVLHWEILGRSSKKFGRRERSVKPADRYTLGLWRKQYCDPVHASHQKHTSTRQVLFFSPTSIPVKLSSFTHRTCCYKFRSGFLKQSCIIDFVLGPVVRFLYLLCPKTHWNPYLISSCNLMRSTGNNPNSYAMEKVKVPRRFLLNSLQPCILVSLVPVWMWIGVPGRFKIGAWVWTAVGISLTSASTCINRPQNQILVDKMVPLHLVVLCRLLLLFTWMKRDILGHSSW